MLSRQWSSCVVSANFLIDVVKKQQTNPSVRMNTAAIKNFKNAEDFEYAVQMTRWLLQPLGIWPLKPNNSVAVLLRPVSVATCTFLLAFLLVPCCLHMFLIEKDIGVRLKMIGPLSFCLMNIFKYFAMLLKDAAVASCIINMAKDWHEIDSAEYKSIYSENARTARYFTSVCALFMYGGGLPYSTILPLTRQAIVIGNDSFNHLAYPSYFIFFNPHIRPIYDLVFLTHCLCGFVMYSVTCGVCSIAILCIMHICSQCNVTSAMLRKLDGSLDEKSCSKIVTHHLRSLKFASKLEDIMNEMCMVELLGCTFNICMLGYYFLTEYEQSETIGTITYSLLLISLTFNIFIFCYIGDLLTEKCQSLGEVAYMINWYHLTSVEARSIVLIIASTQRPVVLTAGKMVTLSVQSFCNVVKAAATYLNMLRTLMANEN